MNRRAFLKLFAAAGPVAPRSSEDIPISGNSGARMRSRIGAWSRLSGQGLPRKAHPCKRRTPMPSDRREYMRKYQLAWIKKRRDAWFADKCCVQCGETENLELDHIDPTTKRRSFDHCVWSWAALRREVELAKCQVLCHDCHNAKTSAEKSVRQHFPFSNPFVPHRGIARRSERRPMNRRNTTAHLFPSTPVSGAPGRI